MTSRQKVLRGLTALSTAALLSAAVGVGSASAAVDPAGCTDDVQYDPSVPTWEQFYSRTGNTDFGAITPLGAGAPGRSTGKNTTANLERYMDALVKVTTDPTSPLYSPAAAARVSLIKKPLGKSVLGSAGVAGRNIAFWVAGTPAHIANLDTVTGDSVTTGDADFWEGIRDGRYSEEEGLAAAGTRPAFGWITATPHGNEPAAGEAIVKQTYELVARLDCQNAQRLQNMDVFLDTVRNPDGRDNNVRTSAYGFDHNRDFGTRNQQENDIFLPSIAQYPGVFFIDAHQQTSGYFFPPNEDPVLHEVSDFSLDFIQNRIGPTLQQVFNDQSSQYQNYNSYDMFTPEYGDSVPSLIMGAAGMTYEKGVDESYSKQVYDHYLAMDTTINLTSNAKRDILSAWVKQWQTARDQGANCQLEPNELVSPLHDQITQQTRGTVCGYFFKPGDHAGDVAALMRNLQQVGVEVFRLDQAVPAPGVHEYGQGGDVTASSPGTLPAGTIYVPLAQGQKHWIQAVMGEDPFIPYPYYYDVVTWSYGLQRGLSGAGYTTQQLPASTSMTKLDLFRGTVEGSTTPDGTTTLGTVPASAQPYYVFDTDSTRGLGLAVDLLTAGATVSRSTAPFTAGGRPFKSGAAVVTGSTTTLAALTTLAANRQTPVSGLNSLPGGLRSLAKPKIGLYTGATTVPSNPQNVVVNSDGAPVGGTGQCSSTYCTALHTLTVKLDLPASAIQPVTSTDLAGGVLGTGGFTALINPGLAIGAGAGATALQTFVNNGGAYVGSVANGIAAARNAGITNVNTQGIANLLTPGTEFDATWATGNPVTLGFDAPAGGGKQGWIYRDASGNPVIDPATLAGSGTIPNATAAVSYGGTLALGDTPLRAYGYNVNATGDGKLDGRPAVIDQPYGQGHATLIGFDPFFRSWQEGAERIVLNGALYPPTPAPTTTTAAAKPSGDDAALTGSGDAAGSGSAGSSSASAGKDAEAAPAVAGEKVAKADLPAVTARPLASVPTVDRDIVITVSRKQAAKLKAAVRKAGMPKRVAKKVRYRSTKRTTTLVIKGVRTSDEHARSVYMSRLIQGLKRAKVELRVAQI